MSPPVPPDPSGPAAVPAAVLRRAHFLMRLSRAWDNRFEALARAGTIGRWYSAVGNEATTVGTALGMQPNDTLSTVHRDLGAVLSTYLDPTRLAPSLFTADEQTDWDRRRPELRPQDRLRFLGELTQEAPGVARVDDVLSRRLRRAERRLQRLRDHGAGVV